MDSIFISHIGLTEKERTLISNLFGLSETWLGNFELLARPNRPEGQILLLNVDDPKAMKQWSVVQRFKQFEQVITIGKGSEPALPDSIHLPRPLIFRRLAKALQEATAFGHREALDHHTFNVLVVDDSLPVRTFMKQKLHTLLGADAGIDVAVSGEEAIQMVSEAEYPLIFMDVMMEGMDGYHACRAIKDKCNAKIVMLTSKSSTLNRVKAHMSGCDSYITKPPDDNELQRVLEKYLIKPHQKRQRLKQDASAQNPGMARHQLKQQYS